MILSGTLRVPVNSPADAKFVLHGRCPRRVAAGRTRGAISQRWSSTGLQAFAAVARYSNFRRAAVERGLSASAFSHVIRGLEETLDVTSCSTGQTATSASPRPVANSSNGSDPLWEISRRHLEKPAQQAGSRRLAASERSGYRERFNHPADDRERPFDLFRHQAGRGQLRRPGRHRCRRLRCRHPPRPSLVARIDRSSGGAGGSFFSRRRAVLFRRACATTGTA